MDDDFFVIPFITEEKLLKEENKDYDEIYLLVKKNKSYSKELFFDVNEYINNIYKSYKMNWENIKTQFIKDFNRLTIYIDKSPIFDKYEFISVFRKYKIKNYINENFSISYYKLLIMLCTQSSFYFLYLYGKTFENIFRHIYKNDDIYIVQGPTKTIHFETSNNEIKFYAILTLHLKNINDNEILNIFYLELNITFNQFYIYNIDINKNINPFPNSGLISIIIL